MLETLLSNRTVSVLWEALPRILSAGLTMTIPLTLVSFTLAMVLAVAVALVQYAKVPVLSQLARFYIWVIRGTPLLVQLFIIFYGLPSVGIMLDAFPAAVIAFAFNEGAYCAETMRGALESVPQGLRFGHLPGDDEALGDVLQGRLVAEEVVVLEDESRLAAQPRDAGAVGVGEVEGLTVEGELACVRRLKKVETTQQGGLA